MWRAKITLWQYKQEHRSTWSSRTLDSNQTKNKNLAKGQRIHGAKIRLATANCKVTNASPQHSHPFDVCLYFPKDILYHKTLVICHSLWDATNETSPSTRTMITRLQIYLITPFVVAIYVHARIPKSSLASANTVSMSCTLGIIISNSKLMKGLCQCTKSPFWLEIWFTRGHEHPIADIRRYSRTWGERGGGGGEGAVAVDPLEVLHTEQQCSDLAARRVKKSKQEIESHWEQPLQNLVVKIIKTNRTAYCCLNYQPNRWYNLRTWKVQMASTTSGVKSSMSVVGAVSTKLLLKSSLQRQKLTHIRLVTIYIWKTMCF